MKNQFRRLFADLRCSVTVLLLCGTMTALGQSTPPLPTDPKVPPLKREGIAFFTVEKGLRALFWGTVVSVADGELSIENKGFHDTYLTTGASVCLNGTQVAGPETSSTHLIDVLSPLVGRQIWVTSTFKDKVRLAVRIDDMRVISPLTSTTIEQPPRYPHCQGATDTYPEPKEAVRLGMSARDVIRIAGIPAGGSTADAIDAGANMSLQYNGRTYVFADGVLKAIE